jgi:putative transposase
MQYRRANNLGACYFFTLATEKRNYLFVNDKNVALLRQAFRHVMQYRPFVIEAAVILLDHLHCIWTLPPNDADFSTRWFLIKIVFTKHCDKDFKLSPNKARIKKQQQAVWHTVIGSIALGMKPILSIM